VFGSAIDQHATFTVVPRLVGTGGVKILVSLTLSLFVYVSNVLSNYYIFRTDTESSFTGVVPLAFGKSGACRHVYFFLEYFLVQVVPFV